MRKTFHLEILTLSKAYWQGTVESLVAPGVVGRLGVLAGHQAGIIALQPGLLEVVTESGEHKQYALGEGFLTIEPGGEEVVIMARSAENPEEINAARAELAVERAEERLQQKRSRGKLKSDLDVERAERALARAIARLKAKSWSGPR